jgi:hypothetical protein
LNSSRRDRILSFDEHLAQGPLHGPPAEEEPCTGLRVREPIARQPRDLPLLRRELVAGLDPARRILSPVPTSSRRARSANASIPMSANI